MSAIIQDEQQPSPLGSFGLDGIRRYKTRCKILVDSHTAGASQGDSRTIHITDDVYALSSSKTIKGIGNITISLTPSQNYLNIIFPNDYINVYFDIGDGSGWVRTFFGFIDRVEEQYGVSKSGTPSTLYRVVCSDFYKAFDRTMIYFNPHLAGRKDFVEYEFAAPNIGGLALLSKGIVVGGAPSDIVENVILLLMGFGTQFKLPSSYNPGDMQKRLRKLRAEMVTGRLSKEARDQITGEGNTYSQFRNNTRTKAHQAVNLAGVNSTNEEERLLLLAQDYGVKLTELRGKTNDQLIRFLSDYKVNQTLTPSKGGRGEAGTSRSLGNRERNILDSTVQDQSSLIDIIDTFTFIERRAMDGYIFGEPVWQQQGSLVSILRSFSNESINEMFFDLRPLSDDGTGKQISNDPIQGAYATMPDDKDGNIGSSGSKPGITYIPAVVMREYPFSTIGGVDLSSTKLSLKDKYGREATIGALYFGAIFSSNPNIPGRHIVYMPNINIADTVSKKTKSKTQTTDSAALSKNTTEEKTTEIGIKHLDVAVISEKEIIKTSLGRSDNDHFNLFEFYSDNLLGTDQKFYLWDFVPIITPIHISRNGLRVRSVTTRAARFSLSSVANIRESTAPNETVEKGDVLPKVGTGKDQIGPPILSPDDVVYQRGQLESNWNYRLKEPDGKPKIWQWHNGIDITKKSTTEYIPVVAIADGWVTVSAPTGAYDKYGNIIVIKHDFEGTAGFRYSVYAHLKQRKVGWFLSSPVKKPSRRGFFAAKGMTGVGGKGGLQKPIRVNKGDTIGYVGRTGIKDSKDQLHFEILRHFPASAKQDISFTPGILLSASATRPLAEPGMDPTGKDMPKRQNSCDPYLFYKEIFGEDLEKLINKGQITTPLPPPPESVKESVGNIEDEQDANKSRADEGVKEEKTNTDTASTIAGVVDSRESRKQISRWALLQDHWYQHNLEYLSGRIDMRGAPEIRVGYRLDIFERNMSFYVESVNHTWHFPNEMITTLQVTRGQPNNPYPLYVLPAHEGMGATTTQRRTWNSRLATYFITPDPVAIRRSLFIKPVVSTFDPSASINLLNTGNNLVNETDAIEVGEDELNNSEQGVLATRYNERVIPAGEGLVFTPEEYTPEPSDKPKQASVTGVDPIAGISKDDPRELNK